MNMVKTPELAAEVTLQPHRRFNVDALIIFSDILVIADAFGLGVNFVDGRGPILQKTVQTVADIDALPLPDVNTLQYVADAIRTTRSRANATVPIIGFAGGPYTVAAYMIAGGSVATHTQIKSLYYQAPAAFHRLLDKICTLTITYLKSQVEAGADALQIFESWALHLSTTDFLEISMPYLTRIVSELRAATPVPITVFCRGSSVFYPLIAKSGATVIGIDTPGDMAAIRPAVDSAISLQGNIDPDWLFMPPDMLVARTRQFLDSIRHYPNIIVNLGHGVLPATDPDQVKRLVDTVHQYDFS